MDVENVFKSGFSCYFMKDWKNNLDSVLKSHLEFQLKEVMKQKKAFMEAKNPSNAQLWVAVANLSKLVSALNTKIGNLEKELESRPAKKVVKKKATKLKPRKR
jgi:hypothetical protein